MATAACWSNLSNERVAPDPDRQNFRNPADFHAMLSGHAISIVLGCLSPTGLFSDRLRITSRSESSCRETVFSGVRSPSSWLSCWRRPGSQRNGRPGGSAFSRSSGSPGSNWRRASRSITRRRSFGGGMPTMPMRPRCSSKALLSLHRGDSSPSRSPSPCRS